jgi:predicted dehydrogenase
MQQSNTRRDFLKTAGAAGAVLSSGVWSDSTARASTSPNEKLNIAMIGAGGRGAANVAEVAGENIVALCDVDEVRAGATFKRYPRAKRHHDFRKMLEEMDREVDAVVVSAPNHIHVPASVMAMRMSKHCYCEKPLAHSVREARLAAKVAAQTKVATQMGTQIHASNNFRRIVELIRSGAIGPVHEVRIRLDGGGTAADRPAETPPVPPGLKWDLWLGPAPQRPYHPCYVPHDWHYWWDFGGGPLGNMGCHYLDLAFWALELKHPRTIESVGSPRHLESTPMLQTVRYQFPARGELPPVMLTWDHGPKRPPFWVEHDLPDWAWGVFVGSKGMLLASYSSHLLWPEAEFRGFQPPAPTIPTSVGHHQEWMNACKTGSATTCNFDYAGAVTETMLLGNVAYRYGEKIEWDAETLRITNAPEAEQYLQREYGKGWTP